MKPVATRDFAFQVTPEVELVDDDVRGLVAGIFEAQLNWQFTFQFLPFEPGMVPPFPADTTPWRNIEGWQTPADARMGLFFHSRFVVTPYDPLAGQEFRFSSQYGAPPPGEEWDNDPWKPGDGVVFYTSTEHYGVLTADLERFLETHSGWNREERALDLQGRPVIDFLVDRLQLSRLVPDELLHWLGLERTPPLIAPRTS